MKSRSATSTDGGAVAEFDAWLEAHANDLPLVAWGPSHTLIAVAFAADKAAGAIRSVLDEALNSGDGSYRP